MPHLAKIPQHLSHETIDGETIVIDLEKGHYYSLEGSASTVWNWIVIGATKESLVAHIPETAQFLQELEGENLLFFEETSGSSTFRIDNTTSLSPPFTLQKFTDMEDLLLLDPIHETDEMGWPHQQQETKPHVPA